MKISDLFESSSDLLADAEDLLISAKTAGLDQIKTSDIVNQLNKMGHSVSLEGLVNLLQDSQIPVSADIHRITVNALPPVSPEEKESNKDKVSKLAMKSGLKGVKKNV